MRVFLLFVIPVWLFAVASAMARGALAAEQLFPRSLPSVHVRLTVSAR